MTAPEKRNKLREWYDDAVAAGIPYCEYLQQQARAANKGAETGEGRLVQSSSHGSLSVSYADDGGSTDEAVEFLNLAADTCLSCTGTDLEKRDCLVATIGVSVKSLLHCYTGLRGCGC